MKILLLSTNSIFGELLRRKISLVGHGVKVADDPDRFYADVASAQWDMVVVVVVSLDESVFKLVSHLRSFDVEPQPRVFVVSWIYSDDEIVALYESGVDEYMSLPIDIRRFISKISSRKVVNDTL